MKKIIFWIILGLAIGGFIISLQLGTDFEDKEDRDEFLSQYGSWLGDVGENTVETVKYIADKNWSPGSNNSNTS